MSLVARWIRDCVDQHPKCALTAPSRLPTRVIDVDARHSPDRLALYEAKSETGRYVALSHCWGKRQIARTLKSTLGQMKQAISWSSLSKTFQDAIIITRFLGMHYIWIDSLCIVQDDKLDWEMESATMASVYEGAYVTIAASLSADGSGGCFATREVTAPVVSAHVSSAPNSSEVYVRESLSHGDFTYDVKPTTVRNPLLTRAWAFQERVLSTRMVHFGQSELLWECRTTSDCECGNFTGTAKLPRIPNNIAEVPSGAGYGPDWVSILWRNITRVYSAKKLTVATDKLPALSAVAAKMDNLDQGTYLAGMWSSHLPVGLLWKVPRPRPLQLDQLTAPTWSWASLDTPVDFSEELAELEEVEMDTYAITAHFLGADCTVGRANPFGQVKDGYLTLIGPVTSGVVKIDGELQKIFDSGDALGEGCDVWEYGKSWPWTLEKRHGVSGNICSVDFFPDQRPPASPNPADQALPRFLTSSTAVICLQILITRRIIFALVLKRSHSYSIPAVWSRVGLLELQRAEEAEGEGWFDGAEETVVKIV
jgi:hypothetical protein